MRDRRTGGDEVAQRYAAHRLELVRLAVLLVEDTRLADHLVQRSFLQDLRSGGDRRDPGTGLAGLRNGVVRECRSAARRRHTSAAVHDGGTNAAESPADALDRLSVTQREVVALMSWAGLNTRQAAVVLGRSERAVRAAWDAALEACGESPAHLAEILHRRAEAVSAIDLRGSWADVREQDARLSARSRQLWRTLAGVGGGAVVVAAAAALVGAPAWQGPPLQAPTTAVGPTSPATTEPQPLSSPALAPGEQPRSAIPWRDVGPGWAVLATAAPPTAVTTTVLLVSPTGTRYPVGTAPDSIVVQDVSSDGRRLLLAVGSEAVEWDVVAGTSRPLDVSFGWKTMRYVGAPDRGYLVLLTDPSSAVRADHWSSTGELVEEYPLTLAPTAGSPGVPGAVLDSTRHEAFVAARNGTVGSIDLDLDAVGALPLPDGLGDCVPRSMWSAGEVLLSCSSGGGRLFVAPLDGAAPRPLGGSGLVQAWAWPGGTLVQLDDPCSTRVGRLGADGAVTPIQPGDAGAGLVPNSVVDGVLYLGGTRCSADGSRLVAYDLASGATTTLAGEEAGRRTVRQAVVLQPHS